jgi:hypothetical protein
LNKRPPNDYALANQGQVKHFALAAIREMDRHFAHLGGAGTKLHRLETALRAGPTAQTNDYAVVTNGQLKALTAPLYDRLLQLKYRGAPLTSGTYPWVNSPNSANDYAAANIGQVKNLFGFGANW